MLCSPEMGPKTALRHNAMTIPDSPRLLARVRDKIRLKHYSIRTEHAYVDWIKRFVWFHGKRHPANLGPAEVESFLTDLAVTRGSLRRRRTRRRARCFSCTRKCSASSCHGSSGST